MSSLFWVSTQCRLFAGVSGEPIDPVFKGQAVQPTQNSEALDYTAAEA
jgi:hypothetical protein